MEASAYIGRVGGLAISLGIGVALTWGAGAAWADTGDSTGSSHASGAASSSGPKASAAKTSTFKAEPPILRAAATPSSRITALRATSTQQPTTPIAPADPPLALLTMAASRRETFGAAPTPRVSTTVTNPSTAAAGGTPTSSINLTAVFQHIVYTPIHGVVEAWIDSDLGQQIDGVINTLAGSYVIGDGADGTAAHPDGGAGGWLLGDGGAGWDSTGSGVGGGSGGAAGFLGNGGKGGSGGAGAAGGTGGVSGLLAGIGGVGGAGGSGGPGVGGVGGAGGDARGLVFGVGGMGGAGGAGVDGGRGGNGGDGAALLGSGGDGGNAGNSGVGGDPSGLPALGGAGGNAGLLGSHGAVGAFGTVPDSSAPQPADGALGPISTTGTWLTNSAGQVVILHGVNEVYKLAPYLPSASGFDDADAAFLAANGFNVVRLGVIWAGVQPQPGVTDTAYLASIKQTVQILADHGIYTIIDMHQDNYSEMFQGEGAPDWATQTAGLPNPEFGFPGNYFLNPAENYAWDRFWSNADAPNGLGLEDNFALAWQSIASSLAGTPGVIGYDIMNEPWPGSTWIPTLVGSGFFAEQQLAPMYNQVAAAIRSVDPNTTLYIEPANPGAVEEGNIFGLPVNIGTIDDPNIVLAFHNYCGGFGPLCSFIANALSDGAQRYAVQHNIPAFMNEFGATGNTAELTDEMRSGDKWQMSWTEWAYTGVGDITTSDTSGEEGLVYDPALAPIGDNVNTSNLKTLAAPYPQVTSGTPQGWSFADGNFEFSYTTEKVDGSGNFAVGAQTIISVPAIEFPNGYSVSVTGGHVVSVPNAPVLVIASDTGAGTVSVVVNGNAAGTQTSQL